MRRHNSSNFGWVDAHLHLDAYPPEDQIRLLKEASAAGGEAVVAVSMDRASSKKTRELAKHYGKMIHPAYGFHPEQALPDPSELDRLFNWIERLHAQKELFSIGEVGLPYYSRTEAEQTGIAFDEEPYIRLLDRFMDMAARFDRTIVLHTVYEDADKACDLLEKHRVRRAHFHWFKGSEQTMKRMIRNGYYISITPDVAYEPEIQAIAANYPIELMMAETDGPWPFEGHYHGRQTVPAMVRDVILGVARLKGMPHANAAELLLRSTRCCYGL